MKLTLGMASYNDFDGVFFTVQALKMYHDLADTEILVIDNYGDQHLRDWAAAWHPSLVRVVTDTKIQGTAYPRDRVFREAQGKFTFCMDSHVLLEQGAVKLLKEWLEAHPNCNYLLQGPMLYDSLDIVAWSLDPVWQDNMWGVWTLPIDADNLPRREFRVSMHGLGLFGCKTDSWLGFNPRFRGFGGEEGYIHEKYRLAGWETIVLPFLKWCHKFGQGGGYSLSIHDRVRNYILGFTELGLSHKPIIDHFGPAMYKMISEKIEKEGEQE